MKEDIKLLEAAAEKIASGTRKGISGLGAGLVRRINGAGLAASGPFAAYLFIPVDPRDGVPGTEVRLTLLAFAISLAEAGDL